MDADAKAQTSGVGSFSMRTTGGGQKLARSCGRLLMAVYLFSALRIQIHYVCGLWLSTAEFLAASLSNMNDMISEYLD